MAETILDIKKWGNSLGVRIPAKVALAAHFYEDQRIRVTVENETIILSPVESSANSLEDRLSRFDPAKHGGEAMQTKRLGVEKW